MNFSNWLLLATIVVVPVGGSCGSVASDELLSSVSEATLPAISVERMAILENFSKVAPKMTEDEVIELLGAPSKIDAYESEKQFIPFYFGSDRTRVKWTYSGLGAIVFSKGNARYKSVFEVTSVRLIAEQIQLVTRFILISCVARVEKGLV